MLFLKINLKSIRFQKKILASFCKKNPTFVGKKKNLAMTYFLGRLANIIGVKSLTAVFGMGTGVTFSL